MGIIGCSSLFVRAYPQAGLKGRPLKRVFFFPDFSLEKDWRILPFYWKEGMRKMVKDFHLQCAQMLRLKLILNITQHC